MTLMVVSSFVLPITGTSKMPVIKELIGPVAVPKEVILIIQIVGGDLLTSPDVHHGSADELEVVRGEADGVCLTGVIDDGACGKESLYIHILVGVLSNNIRIGINDTNHPENLSS